MADKPRKVLFKRVRQNGKVEIIYLDDDAPKEKPKVKPEEEKGFWNNLKKDKEKKQ